MYKHKPRKLINLNGYIHVEVAQVDETMLERAEANFQEGLQKGINENQYHTMVVIF